MVKSRLNKSSSQDDFALVGARSRRQDALNGGPSAPKSDTEDRKPGKSTLRGEQRGEIESKKATGVSNNNALATSARTDTNSGEMAVVTNSTASTPIITEGERRRQRQPQSKSNRKEAPRSRQWKAKAAIEESKVKGLEERLGNNDASRELLRDVRSDLEALKKEVEAKKVRDEELDKKHFLHIFGKTNALQGGRWKQRVMKKKAAGKLYENTVPIKCYHAVLLFLGLWLLTALARMVLVTYEAEIWRYFVVKWDIEILVSDLALLPYLLPLYSCLSILFYAWAFWHYKYSMKVLVSRNVQFIQPYNNTLDTDERPDLLSMSEMKHNRPQLWKVEYYDKYVSPFYNHWATRLFSLLLFDMIKPYERIKHKKELVVSLELISQVLAQPVCRLNVNEEATWLRINQTLASLHTVNEDRWLIFGTQQAVRQNTAVIGHFLFQCIREKASRLPFPRPIPI